MILGLLAEAKRATSIKTPSSIELAIEIQALCRFGAMKKHSAAARNLWLPKDYFDVLLDAPVAMADWSAASGVP